MSIEQSSYDGTSTLDSLTTLLEKGGRLGGLTVFRTALLIVGTNIGIGILSLPVALSETGWIGIGLFVLLSICLGYTAIMLNWCWLIVVDRYHDSDVDIKYPYAYIAEKAWGKKARVFTSAMLLITLYGACIVFILLAGEILDDLVSPIWPGSTKCLWFVFMAVALVPLSWFNKPEEFWPFAIIGNLTIVIALIGIVVELFLDAPASTASYSNVSVNSFFLGFVAFFYSLGGHAIYPSFMHDMRKPSQFSKSIIYAYTFALVVYLIMAVCGYSIYGDAMTANVMLVLKPSGIKTALFICMVVHVWSVFIISFNGVTREVEQQIKKAEGSLVIRLVVRTLVLIGALFISLTMPNFYNVLPLVGATAIPALAVIAPPVLYHLLCNDPDYPKIHIPLHTRVYIIMLVVGGVAIIVIGTYASIVNIIDNSTINPPCYVNWH